MHELGVDLLRRVLSQAGADLAVGDADIGQPELAEQLGRRRGLAAADQDSRLTAAAQLSQRSLEHQLAGAHHPDVRADLLDLGEQVRGDEHGRAVRGDLLDQRPDLAGALRIKAVGRLVQDHQVTGPEQRGSDAEPLLHAERVRAVPLVRRGEQAHLVERVIDARPGGAELSARVGGVAPGQVLPPGQERIERGTLDQRADPRQDRVEPATRVAAEQPEAPRGGVHQAEQHPDRRGLAGAVRPEEPVHAARRNREVDVIDGELPAAEPHGEATRGDGQASLGPGWLARRSRVPLVLGGLGVCQRHLTLAASA